jgi:hypothetical protein
VTDGVVVVTVVVSCAEAESMPPQISNNRSVFFIVQNFYTNKNTNNMPKLASKKSLKDKICPALFLYYKKITLFFPQAINQN